MAFEAPTLDERVEFERAQYRLLIPGADTSDGSDYDIASRVHGTALRGTDANIAHLTKQVLPSTRDGDYLIESCREKGIEAQPAAAATGKVLLSSTTNGDTQLSGSALTHSSGIAYTTTTAGVTATATISPAITVGDGSTAARIAVVGGVSDLAADMPVTVDGELCVIRSVLTAIDAFEPYVPLSAAPSTGDSILAACGVVVSILADTAGANGNQSTRETLTLSSPVDDIEATVTILQLAGGGDAETEAELRGRLLDWYADRPGSGNLADYRDWGRTAPGVRCDDAFVYPGISGLGSVAVVPFGVAGARYLSDEAIALVQANIDAKASFMDDQVVHPGFPTGNDFTMVVAVTPGAGYEPDSDTDFLTHASTPCTTTRLYTSAAVSGYDVGDRIAVPVTVGGITTRYERTLSIITSTYVEVSEELPDAPGVAVQIRSGGPLWQPLYDALLAVVDNLGPGDTTPATRYPPSSVAYPSELYESAVLAAGMDVAGVTTLTATPSSPFPLAPGALSRLRMTSLEITWT